MPNFDKTVNYNLGVFSKNGVQNLNIAYIYIAKMYVYICHVVVYSANELA